MASEWTTMPLSDLVEDGRGISYGIVQPGADVPDGVPIIRVKDIRNGQIDSRNPLRVSPEIEAAYSRTRLKGGELLLTLVGTVGESAVAPASLAEWNTARAVAVIPVKNEVGAYWVRLAIQSPEIKARIDSRLNTTVQATLNLKDVAELPIILPPPTERDRIIQNIGSIDDKIELNRKMNETLEAMARALFKSWFVDFDPVRAKAEDRPTGLPDSIAALFPDSFEESPFGLVPSGWKVTGLDSIATFLNGLALQKYPATGADSLPAIKIAQLRAGSTSNADRVSSAIPAAYVVEDGDVLFSWSGSLECVVWTSGKGALNQHLFKVTSNQYPKWFYLRWVEYHLPDFRRVAAAKATTMGHIQRQHLTQALVVIPPPEIIEAAACHFEPLLDAQISAALENKNLAVMRDALLPKLISGEIRVDPMEGEG